MGASMTFATLAGALLVYQTISLHQESLREEKKKHQKEQFDAQFFPLLKSQRECAARIKIKTDYLDKYGKEQCNVIVEERVFRCLNKMHHGLKGFIRKQKYSDIYEREVFCDMLKTFSIPTNETSPVAPWVEEEQERAQLSFIEEQQTSYLFSKYGISREEHERYKTENDKVLSAFVLGKIVKRQDTSLGYYLKLTNYLLSYVRQRSPEAPEDYLNHIYSLMSEEEHKFLCEIGYINDDTYYE